MGRPAERSIPAGESDSGLFGGNSNWRGPIWFPVNYLLVESLQKFPTTTATTSGRVPDRLRDAPHPGRRWPTSWPPGCAGSSCRTPTAAARSSAAHPKLQRDPHFRDYLLFHEYFHGDTGRGVGASHQTGWTGLVAKLLQPRRCPVTGHMLDLPAREAQRSASPVEVA